MPLSFDLPFAQLQTYPGTNPRPDDFDAFWSRGLAEMQATDPAGALGPAAVQAPYAEGQRLQFSENANYRIQGSIAFAGAARSVWIVAKDQKDASGKRRYMQSAKANLAPDNQGLGLSFEISGLVGKPHVHWRETDIQTPISDLPSDSRCT